MYSKDKIIEIINNEGQYIDAFMLDAFIKNWKLEAIYEDENGVEFFDEEALDKIRTSLAPKNDYQNVVVEEPVNQETTSQEQTEEVMSEQQNTEDVQEAQIVEHVEIVPDNQVIEAPKNNVEGEIKNVTLDITNQTLGVLAESIASKITTDIAKYLKNTDFLQEAMDMGAFKKDNEILAKKVQEIINDNKVLVKKLQELESQKTDYIKVFGNIYIKKN